MRPGLAVLVLFALSAQACSAREDNEARLFIDRVSLIHHDAPAADRRRALAALESLPLTTEHLIRLRDVCVHGHEALLEAEAQQEAAAQALGRVTGGRDDVRIPPAAAREIEASIQRSNDAIARAGSQLGRCQQEVAALGHRYATRP